MDSDIDLCIQEYFIVKEYIGEEYRPSYYSVPRKAGSVRKRLIKILK